MKLGMTRSLRASFAGLLAGASLTTLALGAPSHAFNPAPAPLPAPVSTAASTPPQNLADIVERVSPSVVQIFVRQSSPIQRIAAPEEQGELPPELRDFFGPNFKYFFGGPQGFPRHGKFGTGS